MSNKNGETLVEAFKRVFKTTPHAVARAPGRVNLIGEHIDYEGYGVLPLAIDQAVHVAVGWQQQPHSSAVSDAASCATPADVISTCIEQPAVLLVCNTQPTHPSGQFNLNPDEPLPLTCPSWLKYIHAAYKGCLEHAAAQQQQVNNHGNIIMMVHGDVPLGSGLSSSSALVVSSALALLSLLGITATPQQLADLTCRCERYVGTEGGGMDQAVSVMAQQGAALHVEFNPVRAQPVPLPAGGVLVVANCLAPSLKAETAASRYNLRVLECRLAAMLLAKLLATHSARQGTDQYSAASVPSWRDVTVLKQVEAPLIQYADQSPGPTSQPAGGWDAQQTAELLTRAVKELLPLSVYTSDQVCQLLGCSWSDIMNLLPPRLQQAAAVAASLHLQQRALHVFSESQRVLHFKAVCCAGTSSSSASAQLSSLGSLMDASHVSCADLYQCSCEELDSLVKVAKQAGALGARLTGAGWGGCVVCLVPEDQVDEFISRVHQQYYLPRQQQGQQLPANMTSYLFRTQPGPGARVTCLQ